MMKKVALLFLLGAVFMGLTACQSKDGGSELSKNTTQSMSKVEEKDEVLIESEDSISSSESDKQTEMNRKDVIRLLNDFGDGYANYSSINDRNRKLKKLMTQNAIDMNGIGFDSEVMLESKGKVTNIYQPMDGEKDEYAVLLDCIQNGSEYVF